MLILQAIIPLIGLAAAAAQSAQAVVNAPKRCDNVSPNQEQRNLAASIGTGVSTFAATPVRWVRTHIHVVESGAKRGKITKTMIDNQMKILNERFKPSNIRFILDITTRTVNDLWAKSGSSTQARRDMQYALRKGTYAHLNLYYLSDLTDGGGPLGYCTFPTSGPTPEQVQLDGCVLDGDTMPGGGQVNYNMGLTTVHEVGHWFFLFHVFEGGNCEGSGDQVPDTSPQATESRGCPKGKDSCPNQSGQDSIHNYMDYSDDACYLRFSPDQMGRMIGIWDTLRAQYACGAWTP